MGKENDQHSEEVSRDFFSLMYEKILLRIVSLFHSSIHSILSLFLCSLIQRLDGKSKDISKIAADITQNVSLRQGMERKKVIQHIRGLYKTDLSASRHWQELVQQLTHDRQASTFISHRGSHNIGTKYSHKIIAIMMIVIVMGIFSPLCVLVIFFKTNCGENDLLM